MSTAPEEEVLANQATTEAGKPKRAYGKGKPKCGAKRRGEGRGKLCTRPAGWGTDHVGVGRCKYHGGATPIASGRYSKIARERLGDAFATIENDPNPLDLTPELELMRGQTAYFLSKSGPSPLVADLAERSTRVVDLIHKHRKEGAITLATLSRIMEQLGATVARHVKDPDVLAAIEREWADIRLG